MHHGAQSSLFRHSPVLAHRSGPLQRLLSDQNGGSSSFRRRKFHRHGQSSSPDQNAAAGKNWPTRAVPQPYTALPQKLFEFERAPAALRPEGISGAPTAEQKWRAKQLSVNHRTRVSFALITNPVNHFQPHASADLRKGNGDVGARCAPVDSVREEFDFGCA